MALRSRLRNVMEDNGCAEIVRSYLRLLGVLKNIVTLPATSSAALPVQSPPCTSNGGSHFAVVSSSGVSESSERRRWFQNDPEIATLAHRGHRTMGLHLESRSYRFDLVSAVCQAPRSTSMELKPLHWYQIRKISSSSPCSFSRKNKVRACGKEWASYTRKERKEAEKDFRRYQQDLLEANYRHRPPVKKLPPSEYRQATVDKSTKNMALTPKKWKRLLPSREAVDTVTFLRRTKLNPEAIKEVIRKRVSRLLKLEMMLVLSELQRLDEWVLSRQVFNAIRKESWYRPDVYLYQTMVQMFGRTKQIKEAEKMFEELEAEGLQPDGSIRRELLRAYVLSGMISKAVELYKTIQETEPDLDRAARSILFHGLNPEEKLELAAYEREKGYDWS